MTDEARLRNEEASQKLMGLLFPPVVQIAARYVEEHGMQIDWMDPTATTSKLAVISQLPEAFDFQGTPWPPQHHYTGPWHEVSVRGTIPFPWKRLDGRPLVYASMGTLVNGSVNTYKTILDAASLFPETQFVVSIGSAIQIRDLGEYSENVIVVQRAPQLELLRRATLCVTHAGLNTVLESLTQGVPMVAIPVGYDQPGTAARIAHHGVGEFIPVEEALTTEKLGSLIDAVLFSPHYRVNARRFQLLIKGASGLEIAADVIERAIGA